LRLVTAPLPAPLVRAVALHPQRLRGGPGRHHRPKGSHPRAGSRSHSCPLRTPRSA